MSSTDLTNDEMNHIDRAVLACGGGALLRCELVTWAFYAKLEGLPHERDLLALFFRGEVVPLAMLDEDGGAVFVPTKLATTRRAG